MYIYIHIERDYQQMGSVVLKARMIAVHWGDYGSNCKTCITLKL